ncbi:hypothetical protein B5X24_HaOG214935 [Helicoverpa armigera]|uniref:LRRCT domain-containing protein n=1 Tax=Helicoverpa armigera TaxID=29058 RepID=A0A2W1B9P6_HELAM|nr:hypothetical protein B5X24_HaOG214935 [Helicoverpa armigera]
MSSKYLKLFDVRNNQLTSFEPELVRKIKHEGLVVLFQGNSLKCDCFTRPLKHYLNHIRPSLLKTDEKYQNITCAEPVTLVNENILTIDEDRLLCSGNTEIDAKILEHSNTEGERNSLKCDCFTRPLKHYLNHIRPSLLKTDEKYQNITCAEPVTLVNENILTIDEDRLLCSGNTEIDAKILEHSNTEGESAFDFTAEPDLAFRDVQYSQSSIYAHWFITTNEDVGDFILYIRDSQNKLLFSSNVAYNLRSLTISIDDKIKISLQDKNTHEICIQAKNSNNTPKKWHPRNSLKCDCFTRPLKHYLNHIRPSLLKTDEKYQNITCAEPVTLVNENILTIDEDRLLCSGNTEIDAKILEHSNTEGESAFDFTAEPDLAFRDVQYSQTSIYAHWFITTNEDVGDFILYIRDSQNKLLFSSDVSYNLRSLTIPIDDTLKISLQDKNTHEICIQAKNSNNTPKKWHPSQCQKVLEDFHSWPVKS